MSVRSIEGLVYGHIPGGHVKGMCVLCGHYGCRCEARPTPKRRQRYKPGTVICGLCWENLPEFEIRHAVLGRPS